MARKIDRGEDQIGGRNGLYWIWSVIKDLFAEPV